MKETDVADPGLAVPTAGTHLSCTISTAECAHNYHVIATTSESTTTHFTACVIAKRRVINLRVKRLETSAL